MSNSFRCNIPCVPVRAEAKSWSEMVTQLLYGEPFQILEMNADWTKIKSVLDGYEGFISSNQVSKIPYRNRGNTVIERFTIHEGIPYTLGSFLANEANLGPNNRDLCATAEQLLGAPYLWGGKTFMGIDCSGLVQVSARCLGIDLPRDAYQQAILGELVDYPNCKRNDLAFFANEKGKVTHVGILVSKDQILHASGQVRIDEFDASGIKRNEEGEMKITHKLHSIRRLEFQ